LSINIIAAISQTHQLGYRNQLLCKLSDDLKFFKLKTQQNFCVFGRKTYDSIGGKPLKNRTNIILTRKPNKLEYHPDIVTYSSVDELMYEYENYAEKDIELFICGGEQIYKEFMDKADKMYLTVIQHTFPKADAHFPKFDESEWDKKCLKYQKADENNEYPFYIMEYTRKQSN
jgi:dihydrofolate reductase